jgi:hypothetical protein
MVDAVGRVGWGRTSSDDEDAFHPEFEAYEPHEDMGWDIAEEEMEDMGWEEEVEGRAPVQWVAEMEEQDDDEIVDESPVERPQTRVAGMGRRQRGGTSDRRGSLDDEPVEEIVGGEDREVVPDWAMRRPGPHGSASRAAAAATFGGRISRVSVSASDGMVEEEEGADAYDDDFDDADAAAVRA